MLKVLTEIKSKLDNIDNNLKNISLYIYNKECPTQGQETRPIATGSPPR